jgi:hypothetical protein
MNKRSVQSWLPLVVGAITLLFFVLAAYYVITAERETTNEIQRIAEETPEVYIVPSTRMIDANMYQKQFTEHPLRSYYGVSFRLPWNGEEEEDPGPRGVTIKLSDEQALLLTKETFGAEYMISDVFGEERGGAIIDRMRAAYGDIFLNNPFIFYREVLRSTPDNVTFLSLKDRVEMEAILLHLKQSIVALGKDTIYEFETYHARGFQFGKGGDAFVVIDFVNRENEVYSFLLKGATQEDLDFIIASIR